MDLTDLNYIASAGLRVIVLTQKNTVKNGGFLKLLNVKQDVMEVFEVTGLNNILAFE
ncbi:MAG: STAS domain-containing protein [Spirochaetaceae bacterium]|jgi:anti-anti-sigma factor|nr:STAS domain-containing protein [Spirochaetaceae bacterium]